MIDEHEDAGWEYFQVTNRISEMVFVVPHRRGIDYHELTLDEPVGIRLPLSVGSGLPFT